MRLLVFVIFFAGAAIHGLEDSFTITTDEDEPVTFDFLKYNKASIKLAPKVAIVHQPKYGAFATASDGSLNVQNELCDAHATYIPNLDFSGEDVFVYSYLYENLTTTSDGELLARILVRPKSDTIMAQSDEVTMTTEDGHLHIPVLQNDYSKDRSAVCITKEEKHYSEDKQVKFEEIAEMLGMTAIQQKPPKAPDCLFDQFDPNLKIWIPGSFCIVEISSGAAATADYDGDGLMDLYYARMDGPDQLWRNLGNGTYQDYTAEANLSSTAFHRSSAVVWLDIDNDGDMDLYIGTMAESRFFLYVNDGMGHYTEEAEERGLALQPKIPPYKTSTMTIAVADYNKDGWLDIYTTEWLPHLDLSFDYNNASHKNVKLLRNLGAEGKPGHFEDVTERAGLAKTPEPTVDADRFGGVDVRYYGVMNTGLIKDILPGPFKLGALFTDLDDDGYQDLVTTGDFRTSDVYWNNGDGTFTRGTKEANLGTDENGMGIAVADYDMDGRQDWFVTSIYMSKEQMEPFRDVYLGGGFIFGHTGNRLYRNEGGRKFSDRTDEVGVRYGNWAWGSAFFDYDNDGDLDLIHTNGFDDPDVTDTDFLHHTPTRLYDNMFFEDNNGSARFMETGFRKGISDVFDGRGAFVFDYEEDGDLDVFISNNANRPVFYRNIGGNKQDYIRVTVLEASVDRESIGAMVYLYSPKLKREVMREIRSVSGFSGQGEYVAHFGLGSETEDTFRIRVYWPVTNNTRIIHSVTRRSSVTVRDIWGHRNAVEETKSPSESSPRCTRLLVKEVARAPAHGQVVVGPKHVTYYPDADFAGEDSFNYAVSDGVNSAIATVNVKVTKVDTPPPSPEQLAEKFPRLDAVNNNPDHPDWGKPFMPLLRLLPSAYDDGFDAPAGSNRSSPRLISNVVCDQRIDVFSEPGLNDFHMHFGQMLAHDTDFATPYANFLTTDNLGIPIPEGDPWFDPHSSGKEIMRFRRSGIIQTSGKLHGRPREQVNKVTAFIDLSLVYGSDDGRALALRTMENGKLKHQSCDIIDFNKKELTNLNLLNGPRDKMLVSGDNRVNVQPGLIAFHTLWSREHNRICDELLQQPRYQNMDDQTLFNHARTLTRAKWQKIVWNEFLPTVIGLQEYENLGEYKGYNSSIHVGIFNEFGTAAFRFGHSQVGNIMPRLDENWTMIGSGHLSLRDAYFNPGRVLREGGIEPLIRGMMVQKAQKVDLQFSDSVRNFLFGTNTMGLDLVAINIQRGRDHGLPDYNTVREGVGLPKRTSFADITPDKTVHEELQKVYSSVDDIDLWIGGLAEPHVEGGCVGETFARIIALQYRVLRDGDRFWYENTDTALYQLKDRTTLPTKGTSMVDVLYRNTGIKWKGSPFFVKDM